ncbi:MAG TPA: SDR family NAD(P)-dependent oxidoreductase [Kofleriaceae bacterium]
MSKTIVVCGYGPGISHATAERFGAEGFAVALVGRTAARLADGAKRLESRGIRAAAFAHDLGEPGNAGTLASQVRERLGAISVIHWNAYSHAAGDLSTAPVAELRGGLDLAVGGLVALYQAARTDLESQPDAVRS